MARQPRPVSQDLPLGSAATVSRNVVGLYPQPNSAETIASQLVFGSDVRILEYAPNADLPGSPADAMARIKGPDRYEGWMRSRDLTAYTDRSDFPQTTIASLIADIYSAPDLTSRIVTKLCVATDVTLARHDSEREFTPIVFPAERIVYTHRGNLSSTYLNDQTTIPIPPLPSAEMIRDLRTQVVPRIAANAVVSALRFIGSPYLWGGVTPFGIDCSGLTQVCYKIAGIQLLRDAWMQMIDKRFSLVETDRTLAQSLLMPGDLIFFHSRTQPVSGVRRIVHVGLAIGDGTFIHAAGAGRGVMVSECDEAEWSEIYAGAARLSPDADFSIESA